MQVQCVRLGVPDGVAAKLLDRVRREVDPESDFEVLDLFMVFAVDMSINTLEK